MEQEIAIHAAARELNLTLKEESTITRQMLVDRINEWLQTDFEKLVAALYRIDVSEEKLRALLQQQPGQDAAEIITGLVLERQLQKLKTRAAFRPRDEPIDENEKW